MRVDCGWIEALIKTRDELVVASCTCDSRERERAGPNLHPPIEVGVRVLSSLHVLDRAGPLIIHCEATDCPGDTSQLGLRLFAHNLRKSNFASQRLSSKVRILSQRPTEPTHVNISLCHSFSHAMGISPATSGADDSTRLYRISNAEECGEWILPALSSIPEPTR